MKGARITSPDLQQNRADGETDQTLLKVLSPMLMLMLQQLKKSNQGIKFPPQWFLHIRLHRELLPHAVLEHTGRDGSRRLG